MTTYLIDTNHFSKALDKVSKMRDRIQQARRSGHRLITIYPVLCELETGIQQGREIVSNRRQLRHLLEFVRVRHPKAKLARDHGAIFLELKSQGRSLSITDIMLAVLARRDKATILSTDGDFEALPDIAVENWVDGV
jgi:tRNA(fMet)-specific endonuclease VapC